MKTKQMNSQPSFRYKVLLFSFLTALFVCNTHIATAQTGWTNILGTFDTDFEKLDVNNIVTSGSTYTVSYNYQFTITKDMYVIFEHKGTGQFVNGSMKVEYLDRVSEVKNVDTYNVLINRILFPKGTHTITINCTYNILNPIAYQTTYFAIRGGIYPISGSLLQDIPN